MPRAGIDNVNTGAHCDMDQPYRVAGNDFIWNAAKARNNRQVHGVSFEEAASALFDPLLIVVDASRNHEARQAVIGFAQTGRLLFVVNIELEDACIRIISARPANPGEEKTYAD